ncbi:MAG: treP [Frankiales bacterium]|nr:treP [Frankiales bacterium]
MIEDVRFPVEPWVLRETALDLSLIAQTESLFALSNGHIGLRGNLDEGDPHGIPGSYLAGFFEQRELPYAEAGYGYPEAGQSVVDVTNGKLIRLFVDDEPLDVRYGMLSDHERLLDLRAGTLTRSLTWTSPAGKSVRVVSRRLVSLTHRAVAAISYEVEALQDDTRIIVQSQLVANEAQPSASKDPRVSAALTSPLVPVQQDEQRTGAILLHRTRQSGLLLGAGMDHHCEAPGEVVTEQDTNPDWARTTFATVLQQNETLRLRKLIAYGWSAVRSEPAILDQVSGALTGARTAGWDGLAQQQRTYLDDFWRGADVQVEGDPVIQQAVRFGLFHVLQSGARAEQRAISAKGLTGPGYDGHAFWDTEGYVLSTLTFTQPSAARDALLWRHSTLPRARLRAAALGLPGASFPWRTIDGDECSAYWPAGTAAFHVNADIAYAVERYRWAAQDEAFDRDIGVELLVETARLWIGLGHHDRHGAWHLDGVTGPDEYSAVADDNVFTNLMAARNLRAAVAACDRHPARAHELQVSTDELQAWRSAAESVHVPYDKELQVHEQAMGFTRYRDWDFTDAQYPLFLHSPYFSLYRSQVLKQVDLVLAMHWCGESFTAEEKARNVDYYEPRTVRDSSLSACTQAVMCAEVGHLELAHDYAMEAALIDLHDLHHNSADGLHMASLAGAWTALVEGFGGMRVLDGRLHLRPVLPQGIDKLGFHVRWQGSLLHVGVDHREVTLVAEGSNTVVFVNGAEVELLDGQAATRPVARVRPLLPRPTQPPGRAPKRVTQP